MKNNLLVLACVAALGFGSCSKSNSPATTTTNDVEGQVITNFVNVVANPNYVEIQTTSVALQAAVTALIATPNAANLLAAQNAWKATRAPWESCEGFLFGPVEDNYYDPTMDSWPLNKADVDAILAGSDPLALANIDVLDGSSKGFHAIEYFIFGVGGTKKATDITAREKLFLASATQSLVNTTTQLRDSWATASGNYSATVTTAGKGSSVYKTRKDLFKAMVGSMSDICNEVGTSKMQDPYAAKDSTLDESSFSHNSTTDFTNNIKGILNVYTCTYNGVNGTASLSTLVAAKNASLDAKIKTQYNAVVASFATITHTFEKAIYDQRAQVKATQDAIAALQVTLDVDLNAFVEANIKD
ncbi:imelysin family protein [Mucilaginibacter sp. FT3.2]|uniref:imelysin family protein n=1 Tax=Mucilaginibacter sp. FT3.2 TaxID=2723090 RepID=UPI001613DEEA|nr:imelysin family protein [Mucilaginibacter sp. FT3.2]MBB6233177.1 putative iron-regulated protein [Mucilaginibacter sp. FT3.2]